VVDVLSRLYKLAGNKDNTVVDLLADHTDDVLQRYEELDAGRLAPMLVKQRRWIDVLLKRLHGRRAANANSCGPPA